MAICSPVWSTKDFTLQQYWLGHIFGLPDRSGIGSDGENGKFRCRNLELRHG